MPRTIKLPDTFAAQLAQWPEDGMGYQYVDIMLKDGRVVERQVAIDTSLWMTDEEVAPEAIIAVRRAELPNAA